MPSRSAQHSPGPLPPRSRPAPDAVRRIGSPLAAAGLMLVLTLCSYAPVRHAGFIWDDDAYITRNKVLIGEGGLPRIWFELGATPQYYPMVFTGFWIEHRLWGLAPAGYHAVNVVLHAMSAILLWLILRRLGVPGAWFAAAVFAVHPVHVESVAWVTERKNVLSGVFALGSLLCYLRFRGLGREPPTAGAGRTGRLCYAAALLLFAGGLLSKTVVCSLPVVIGLILWWKRGRLRRADLWPLIPMLIVGAVLGLTTVWVEKHVVGARGRLFDLSAADRCLIAGRAVWFYAAKLLWPHPLIFSYPRWQIDSRAAWQYLYPAGVLAALAALWFLRSRIGRGPVVALACFVIVLFPALGFINVYPMRYSFVADHFQYHASIAMISLAAAVLARAAGKIAGTPGGSRGPGAGMPGVPAGWSPARIGALVAGGALLAALGLKTFHRLEAYRDPETLWRTTLEANPRAALAWLNLARMDLARRDLPRFIEHTRKAMEFDPGDPRNPKAIADALAYLQRYGEAEGFYRQTLAIDPEDGEVHHNLANILEGEGKASEAIDHYRESIRLRPADPLPHYSLGLLHVSSGKAREAVAEFRAALRLGPRAPVIERELAWLLATHPDAELRSPEEALELAAHASTSNGNSDPLYLDTLAAAQARLGQWDQAVETARRAGTLIGSAGDPALALGIRRRLALYERSQPYTQGQ